MNLPLKKRPEPQTMLPYGRQSIDGDDIQAVADALRSDFLTTGPKIEEFEKALCEATDAKHAVVCGNGTQALHLALLAAGIGKGDSVIVPSITFLATANAARYCGADVVFADVDPETGLMHANHLAEALQRAPDNVKAVLPVHLKGQCADMAEIRACADKHNLKVVTDSCHALGSSYVDTKAGSCQYEDMATFSFHPVKTIAMGEGGAVTTNNADYADAMRKYRNHGMHKTPDMLPWAYEMLDLGYNYRASDIHCALGISQMKKLDGFIEKRRKLAALYDELLQPLAPIIKAPQKIESGNPAWHLYAVQIDFSKLGIDRASLMKALMEEGIGTQVHYIPVHTQPYYKELYGEQTLKGAKQYYERTLSLPLYPNMQESDVHHVVKTLSILAKAKAA